MSKQRAEKRRGENAAELMEVCSVRLGSALYGLPISHILEIVGQARPRPVPLAPGFVGGLVHYRGDVLTVVSLRHLLRMPPCDGLQDVLVLESPGGCFGLLVDSVGEVLKVAAAAFERNPSTLDQARRDLIAGAYKLENALIVMLDPERLDPVRLGVAEAA